MTPEELIKVLQEPFRPPVIGTRNHRQITLGAWLEWKVTMWGRFWVKRPEPKRKSRSKKA